MKVHLFIMHHFRDALFCGGSVGQRQTTQTWAEVTCGRCKAKMDAMNARLRSRRALAKQADIEIR